MWRPQFVMPLSLAFWGELLGENGTASARRGPYSERNARNWKQYFAVCVYGSFTTAASLTTLLPFLPIFVEELGIKQHASIVQWSALAYGATFLGTGLAVPLWCHLGDRYGRNSCLQNLQVSAGIFLGVLRGALTASCLFVSERNPS